MAELIPTYKHTPKKGKKIRRYPKSLETLEKYRQMLVESPTKEQIMKELNLSDRGYHRLLSLYKEIYYSPAAIEQKTKEDIEKMSVVEKKAYEDLMAEKIKYKEYTDVNEYNLKVRARFGLAPNETTVIEHKSDVRLDVDIINKYLKLKHKDKSDEDK